MPNVTVGGHAVQATNSFDVITKFLPKALDQYMVEDSKTIMLENGSKFIDVSFDESGYVKIAEFLLDGLSNYYRTQEWDDPDNLAGSGRPTTPAEYAAYAGNMGTGERDGFAIGGTTVRWQIFKLQWCRGRQFRIDHISNEETGGIVTGGIIEEFNRVKVIPEVDACRFSTIADTASRSLGNLVYEQVSSSSGDQYINESNILKKFFTMRTWMLNRGVKLEDMIWYMTHEVYAILVNSDKLTKFITQGDFKSGDGLTFEVQKFNGIPIVEVGPDRFFTGIQVTNNGYQATSDSRAINYMLVSKKAIVPVRKLEVSKMYGEDEAGIAGYYGKMMNYLLYHGIVIPRNKIVAVFVSVDNEGGSPLGKSANRLDLIIVPGNEARSWRLKATFTMPAGMRGIVCYSANANAFTVGNTVTINGSTIKVVGLDDQVTESAGTSAVKYYFALVDYRGRVLATSDGQVEVVAASE